MPSETKHELIERLKGYEVDHEPDGWPAIKMKDISEICNYAERLEKVLRKLIRMYVVSDESWNHEEDTERHYKRLMNREE